MSNRLQSLLARIARIRLPHQIIAEQSGLDLSTLSRAFNGKTDPLNSTLDKIERVVAEEEQKLGEALVKGAA